MKTSVLTIENRIGLVEDWLLNSGIQSDDGGFYAWQDMDDRSHSYLYSEITGYAITTLCFLYKITKEDIFLKKARSAAQWILQDALDKTGGVLTRSYIKNPTEHYSFERGNIYSFDCAMVAFGMAKLYEITLYKEYLDCAEKIVDFLNSRMSNQNGLYYPIFDTKKDMPYNGTGKWSTQSGSFHCKLALCLCFLGRIKNEKSFMIRAKYLIDSSLDNFYKEGRLITNQLDETSHLHPYSYTLEGILYYTYATKDATYTDILEKAFDWVSGLQEEDGSFPMEVFGSGKRHIPHKRCDIQSQILRLSYFIKSNLDRERLIERFLALQNAQYDYRGGFLFGNDEDGSFKRHSNAWCSMFALQALYLASGKVNKDIVLDYLV